VCDAFKTLSFTILFSDKGFTAGPANAVSFRHGSNVEFEGPSFVNTAGGGAQSSAAAPDPGFSTEFHLGSVSSSSTTGASSLSTDIAAEKRDFSNPMYEAMGDMETHAAELAAKGAGMGDVPLSGPDNMPPSAVIAPSSVTHKGSPVVRRPKEVAPSTVDTGKDTQCLVEEDDSEC
jgi:hypothetical protein